MQFKCSQCGLCCRYVKAILDNPKAAQEPYRSLIEQFPFTYFEDGSCEMLIDNKCSIYEDRPLLCNVERIYETYFSEMDKGAFYKEQNEYCNAMIKKAGLPDSYLIKTDDI